MAFHLADDASCYSVCNRYERLLSAALLVHGLYVSGICPINLVTEFHLRLSSLSHHSCLPQRP